MIDRSDFAIVTACDRYAFAAFQLMYLSLMSQHDTQINVFDIGLTTNQREWCERQDNIILHKLTYPLLIDSNHKMWQTWNKPVYFQQMPQRQILWIDSDCIILDYIDPIINRLEEKPVFIRDQFVNQEHLANSDYVYEVMPVPYRHKSIYVNGGIIGLDKERDSEFLSTWISMISEASSNDEVREGLRWWDQGALNWAIEKVGLLKSIWMNHRWNSPGIWPDRHSTVHQFLDAFHNPNKLGIMHYAGEEKPYRNWPEVPLPDVPKRQTHNLRIYSLWHDKNTPNPRTRPYIEEINMAELNCGIYQENHLAEARAFLSDLVERGTEEYIGFLTARFNSKYERLLPMQQMHNLPLRPNIVWCADPAHENWSHTSNSAHPGILSLLEEMAAFTKLPLIHGPSLYSNNFICHRNVMRSLVVFFRKVFHEFHNRYWYDLPFNVGNYERRKAAAYFYERITMHYFANRTDLSIRVMDENAIKRTNKIF